MYAINIDESNRILSACEVLPSGHIDEKGIPTDEEHGTPVYDIVDGKYNDMPVVEALPEGDDVSHYLYVDGEYIYDPLPEPEPIEPEPTAEDMMNAMLRGLGYE